MKLKKLLAVAFAAAVAFGGQTAQAQSLSPSTKWHWDKVAGKIPVAACD